jgi:hypothetical protein
MILEIKYVNGISGAVKQNVNKFFVSIGSEVRCQGILPPR